MGYINKNGKLWKADPLKISSHLFPN